MIDEAWRVTRKEVLESPFVLGKEASDKSNTCDKEAEAYLKKLAPYLLSTKSLYLPVIKKVLNKETEEVLKIIKKAEGLCKVYHAKHPSYVYIYTLKNIELDKDLNKEDLSFIKLLEENIDEKRVIPLKVIRITKFAPYISKLKYLGIIKQANGDYILENVKHGSTTICTKKTLPHNKNRKRVRRLLKMFLDKVLS